MHDHNLDDLIVDNINPKNTKTKSFLTIIALAIIVLIIAIILTKLVLKQPLNDIVVTHNDTTLISPELTLTQNDDPVKTPTIAKPSKAQKNTVQTDISDKDSIAITEKPKITSEKKPPIKISSLFKEETPTEVSKPTPDVSSTASQKRLFYIQVGSFTKTPSERFLSIIRKSGFDYMVTPASANGTKKLLIGPYKTKDAMHDILVQVKERINKSAFIIQR